ncbi:MAG: IS30 family transposase [Chloroflexota bacterium]|nr:IS30 family transposase [Chloroflexota bacterium]
MRGLRLSLEERIEIRRRLAAGESSREIGAALGRSHDSVDRVRRDSGGVPPRATAGSDRCLSLGEREEISRGLVAGGSFTAIAVGLGRSCSTVSREVHANGGRVRYRAWDAHRRAHERARRPKPGKLRGSSRLQDAVVEMLEQWWSPQQIARRLRAEHPNDPEMWVSHETIYQSLFVQGRGELRRELARCLRTGRTQRRAQGRTQRRGRIPEMVMISERPAEVADRAVPGHWEGDLIIGKNGRSAIATLVERSTRYVMLARITNQRAETVREAIVAQITQLPAHLRRSLTWDQGPEMAEHVRFSVESGVAVYFCDPHSPWQRGSNENTNGLLRQYFPKSTPLSGHTQDHLDTVAASLNNRPRQTLDWMKPSEKLAELLATTA